MVLFFRDFKGSSDLIWCGWATIVNLWTPVTLKNRQPCWKWICWVTAVMVDQWIVLSFNLSASFSYIFLFIYVLLVVLAQCKLFCALLLFCFVLLSVCAAVYPEHSWHCGLLCPGCSAHNQKGDTTWSVCDKCDLLNQGHWLVCGTSAKDTFSFRKMYSIAF